MCIRNDSHLPHSAAVTMRVRADRTGKVHLVRSPAEWHGPSLRSDANASDAQPQSS